MRTILVSSPKIQHSTIPSILIAAIFWTVTLCAAMLGQEQAQPVGSASRSLIVQTVDESQLTILKGNTYPLARAEFDLGTAPATLPMERMLLVLKRSPEQEATLTKLLDDQQDQASPNYHKWLSPEEFGRQYGPSDSDLQTITLWLQSHGFQVGSTKGRTVLEFSGSASQVQEAFHTTIHKYVVNGEQHWANASDPSIPTALAPAVAGIDSLHNFPRKAMNRFVGKYSEKTKRLAVAEPNFTFACNGGYECFGVVPYDFATIYDVLPLWNNGINGSGQTIAIVGRTNINPQDATTFWQLFGLTVPSNKLNIILNGPDPGINVDEAEADIDVQWSGAVAPQATVDFVTSESTETTDGVDLSAIYIVDNNLAPVMSESYGECELWLGTGGNQFHYAIWEQAAAQGISVFVSSGDNGAAGCDNPGGPAQFGLNVNGLASTPFNAAVGGTDFNQYNKWTSYWNTTNNTNTQESAKGYIPETTWNDSCTNSLAITLGYGTTAEQACNNPSMIAAGGVNSTGGSGGPSNCVVNQGVVGSCTQGYVKPSWQGGTGVPVDAHRDLPDVSLFASNGFLGSFYLICQQDATGGFCDLNNFAGYGGTSVASPAFAGIMALVNEKMGSPQGVPGFALYQLASKEANAFHDVPSGSTIAMPCYTGRPNCVTNTGGDSFGILFGYSTTTGYDLGTGLGSVDAANLVNNWGKATFTTTTTTQGLNAGNPVSVTHGTPVPVSIAVSPSHATGAAALLVSNAAGTTAGRAIDGFTLSSGATASGATTSLLPGGSNYYVIAHYSGDGTYGGSHSTPVQVTVSPENSIVVMPGLATGGGTATTVNYDSEYWLRVDVQNSQGKFCTPPPLGEVACPTGSITVTDNGNPFGTGASFVLNSEGYTETRNQLVALIGGAHTLTAQYSGDNSYNSNSVSVAVTVNKAPTNTSYPNTQGSYFTQPVTINTSVQDPNALSYDATPTGQVTFYSNGTAIPGTVTYGNGGFETLTATQTTTFSSLGTYTITATYGGDQNYLTSTSGATYLTLTYPPPVVSLNPASQIVASGSSATLTALADTSNKSVYPTGTITFMNANTGVFVSGPTPCTSVIDSVGNYACQAAATFTATSTEMIVSQYSGDANYPSSVSSPVAIDVPDFSLTTPPSVTIPSAGQSQNLTVNVNTFYGFNGTVSNFTCSGLPAESSCSFSPGQVAAGGSTTVTITTKPLGQFRRRASGEAPIWWRTAAGVFLLGGCLMGVPISRRRRGFALTVMVLTLSVLLPSCGGGSGGGGTNNPVPSISSLSPNALAAGSAPQALVINGSGFIATSAVTYNGIAHTPTLMSASQLSIPLTSGDLAAQGVFPVIVTNPFPGGGASGSVNFNVESGTPTGNFNVTVTANSGSLTHSATFTLVVQ